MRWNEPMPSIETPPAAARSAIMRAVGPRSRAEDALAAAMDALGFPPDARNDRSLPGSPDLVFRAARLAVFVDGAFWHGRSGTPKTNSAWWEEKFRRNRERDGRADAALAVLGWRAMRLDADACLEDPCAAAAAVAAALEGV